MRLTGLRVLGKSLDLIPRAVAIRAFILLVFCVCRVPLSLSGMCPVKIFICYYIIGRNIEVRGPDEK